MIEGMYSRRGYLEEQGKLKEYNKVGRRI